MTSSHQRHGFYDEFPGAHGWSTDHTGLTDWEFSSSPAYTFDVVLDGEAITLRQRERPQVVVNSQTLALEYLFNGVTISGEPHSLNMVTRICNTTSSSPASSAKGGVHC